ncbi:LysE/ArgO family amino acid transporter [Vibrio gallicus]|uniref:LysE/ArgO family amino acid transporter n=1 Tax=Vibrio gallicus TaxID=190897 RepID=UPI0021C2686A|nr:LysE/ArgO family amino acid transporter [Vibrio gallicus]
MSVTIFAQGVGLGLSMIAPIGVQNAYVLNQGIKRNHHIAIATVCSFLDVLFISLGIFGGGALLAKYPMLLAAITIAGIAFVAYYGLLSFKSALNPSTTQQANETSKRGLKAAIFGAMAVTLFNPHLYLDTVVILGSLGGQFQGDERMSFAVGTISASFIWFYGISLGAAKLSPILAKPKVQQGIDLVVGIFMLTIAYYLGLSARDLIQQF